MNKLASVLLVALLVCTGCVKIQIRKELNKIYTDFKIIEVRKDSANVYDAINRLRSLKVVVSHNNLLISTATGEKLQGKRTEAQYSNYADSIYKRMIEAFTYFESTAYEKFDPCYYVKYTVAINGLKQEKEAYFYFDPNNRDILSRPYDWQEFLRKNDYSQLLDEAMELYPDINH